MKKKRINFSARTKIKLGWSLNYGTCLNSIEKPDLNESAHHSRCFLFHCGTFFCSVVAVFTFCCHCNNQPQMQWIKIAWVHDLVVLEVASRKWVTAG